MGFLLYVYRVDKGKSFIESIKDKRFMALYFIGSTWISTIPGISIAGASRELTLYTPAIDVEYLVHGIPKSTNQIPVTPEGIPTPALITRAALITSRISYLIVNTGSYIEPKVPHIALPSRCVGERIDVRKALPYNTVEALYDEACTLANQLSGNTDVFILGESISGGTTTALGILTALGYNAWGLVSSSAPKNPHNLKEEVVRKGLSRVDKLPVKDPFRAVSLVGDPAHISIAGFLACALRRGLKVILAGGTQMAAVLGLIKHLGMSTLEGVAVGTTRWILEDKSSNIIELVRMIAPEVPIIAFNLNFSKSPYRGLRYYEKGYVKEGVGAGGTSIAALVKGVSYKKLHEVIHQEYERLVRGELGVKEVPS